MCLAPGERLLGCARSCWITACQEGSHYKTGSQSDQGPPGLSEGTPSWPKATSQCCHPGDQASNACIIVGQTETYPTIGFYTSPLLCGLQVVFSYPYRISPFPFPGQTMNFPSLVYFLLPPNFIRELTTSSQQNPNTTCKLIVALQYPLPNRLFHNCTSQPLVRC